MRTIIWFIYFWGYLLAVLPKTHRMKKLTQAGKIEERDAIVTEAVQKWSRRLLKLAGVKVTVQGLENIPEARWFSSAIIKACLIFPHCSVIWIGRMA